MRIAESYIKCETWRLGFEKDNPADDKNQKSKQINNEKQDDVYLSISRENQKSASVNLSDLKESASLLNDVKISLENDPDSALQTQGNISYDTVSKLI
jgi:hypothetical protein